MTADSTDNLLANRYLTFRLADESYGIQILKVQEIIRLMHITPVPATPAAVRGVINLRGKIVPVVDLRTRFQMTSKDTAESCIIVVVVGGVETGVVVDCVSEVLNIDVANVGETPDFGANVNTQYLLGIGKTEGGVTLLLDIDKVLEVVDIESAIQPSTPRTGHEDQAAPAQ